MLLFAPIMMGLGGPELIFLLIPFLFLIPPIIAIVHTVKRDDLDSTSKLMWVLISILVPFFGWLIYFIVGRKKA